MTRKEAIEFGNLWLDVNEKYRDSVTVQFFRLAVKALEQEPKWIPLKTRPMTEEETEHYFEYMDMRIDDTYTILDCPLPDDGQEVLVSWGGNVGNDVFVQDNEGCYFEGVDIDDVDAWMPLPQPYKGGQEDGKGNN